MGNYPILLKLRLLNADLSEFEKVILFASYNIDHYSNIILHLLRKIVYEKSIIQIAAIQFRENNQEYASQIPWTNSLIVIS